MKKIYTHIPNLYPFTSLNWIDFSASQTVGMQSGRIQASRISDVKQPINKFILLKLGQMVWN